MIFKVPKKLESLSRLVARKPIFFSFNIADRCPNGCHCYWRAQARVPELSDEDVIQFFRDRRDEGYLHVTIVGGEPYVRRSLLTRVTKVLSHNWIVTSGVLPLLNLKNTVHFVSVDGGNAETHNRVRKSVLLYERLTKNIRDAREKWHTPLYIHTVINIENMDQIEEIYDTWSSNGLADGWLVSTMTPIKDAADDHLRLSIGQRKKIVDRLLKLKIRDSGNFLVMSRAMIERLSPDFTKNLTPHKCGAARFVSSYDAAGKQIPQCILSDKADCTQCGCVITTMTDALVKFPPDLGTIRVLAGKRH